MPEKYPEPFASPLQSRAPESNRASPPYKGGSLPEGAACC